MTKTVDLDMADWYCKAHPDAGKEYDGEHWICTECGEPLEEKTDGDKNIQNHSG